MQLAGVITHRACLPAVLAHLCEAISATVVLTRRHRPVAEQEEDPLREVRPLSPPGGFPQLYPCMTRTSFFLQAACFRRPRFHR